eukprot:Rmarinus@m.26907
MDQLRKEKHGSEPSLLSSGRTHSRISRLSRKLSERTDLARTNSEGPPDSSNSLLESSSGELLVRISRLAPFVPTLLLEAYGFQNTGRSSPIPSLLSLPSSEQHEGSVLFIDASGFTKLGESFAKESRESAMEKLGTTISGYFTPLISIVDQYGGDVTKFAGDAMLVLFSTRQLRCSVGSTAARAVACALRIIHDVHHPLLSVHCGVGSGHVTAMFLGTPSRADALISGPALLQAASAAEHAATEEVVVSPETFQVLGQMKIGASLDVTPTASLTGARFLIVNSLGQDMLPDVATSKISTRFKAIERTSAALAATAVAGDQSPPDPLVGQPNWTSGPEFHCPAFQTLLTFLPPAARMSLNHAKGISAVTAELRQATIVFIRISRQTAKAHRSVPSTPPSDDPSAILCSHQHLTSRSSSDDTSLDLKTADASAVGHDPADDLCIPDSKPLPSRNCSDHLVEIIEPVGSAAPSSDLSGPGTRTVGANAEANEVHSAKANEVNDDPIGVSSAGCTSKGTSINTNTGGDTNANEYVSYEKGGSAVFFETSGNTPPSSHLVDPAVTVDCDIEKVEGNSVPFIERGSPPLGNSEQDRRSSVPDTEKEIRRSFVGGDADLILASRRSGIDLTSVQSLRLSRRRSDPVGAEEEGPTRTSSDNRNHDEGPALDLSELSTAFAIVQSALDKFEGTLCRLQVDEKGTVFKVAFGLPPLSHEEEAYRGSKAALEIHGKLSQRGYAVGIGIATGKVYCGIVGSVLRCEYTPVGPHVNLAARLMQQAIPHNRVICDEDTVKLCGEMLAFIALNPAKLKGREEMTAMYMPCETNSFISSAAGGRSRRGSVVARSRRNSVLDGPLSALSDSSKLASVLDPAVGGVVDSQADSSSRRLSAACSEDSRVGGSISEVGTVTDLGKDDHWDGSEASVDEEGVFVGREEELAMLRRAIQCFLAPTRSFLREPSPYDPLERIAELDEREDPDTGRGSQLSSSVKPGPQAIIRQGVRSPPPSPYGASRRYAQRNSRLEHKKSGASEEISDEPASPIPCNSPLISQLLVPGSSAPADTSDDSDASGRPQQCYFITGEAGVGKTAFVDRVLELERDLRDDCILYTTAVALEHDTSYYMFRALVACMLDVTSASNFLNDLGKFVPSEERLSLTIALRPALPYHVAEQLPMNDAKPRQEDFADAFRTVLKAYSAIRPCIVIVEDVQWVDETTWPVIVELLRHPLPRVVYVVTSRLPEGKIPDLHIKLLEMDSICHVKLNTLSFDEVRKLVIEYGELMDASGVLVDQLARTLMDRTRGHPLFITQLMESMKDRGLLQVTDGGGVLFQPSGTDAVTDFSEPVFELDASVCLLPSSPLDGVQFSDTLRGTVTVRIDRLSRDEQAVLRAASVIGRTFNVQTLLAILPENVPQDSCKGMDGISEATRMEKVLILLQSLKYKQFLEGRKRRKRSNIPRQSFKNSLSSEVLDPIEVLADGGTFTFYQSIIQEAAYELIPFNERQVLHAKLAEEYVLRCFDPDVFFMIGHHYDRSGNAVLAASFLGRAGIAALDAGTIEDTVKYLARALLLISKLKEPDVLATLSDKEVRRIVFLPDEDASSFLSEYSLPRLDTRRGYSRVLQGQMSARPPNVMFDAAPERHGSVDSSSTPNHGSGFLSVGGNGDFRSGSIKTLAPKDSSKRRQKLAGGGGAPPTRLDIACWEFSLGEAYYRIGQLSAAASMFKKCLATMGFPPILKFRNWKHRDRLLRGVRHLFALQLRVTSCFPFHKPSSSRLLTDELQATVVNNDTDDATVCSCYRSRNFPVTRLMHIRLRAEERLVLIASEDLRHTHAAMLLTASLKWARKYTMPETARLLALAALVSYRDGYEGDARVRLERAEAIVRETDDVFSGGMVAYASGLCCLAKAGVDNLSMAAISATTASKLFGAAESHSFALRARVLYGLSRYFMGSFENALDVFVSAKEEASSRRSYNVVVEAATWEAGILLAKGSHDEACRLLYREASILRTTGNISIEFSWLAVMAMALYRCGDLRSCEAYSRRAVRKATAHGRALNAIYHVGGIALLAEVYMSLHTQHVLSGASGMGSNWTASSSGVGGSGVPSSSTSSSRVRLARRSDASSSSGGTSLQQLSVSHLEESLRNPSSGSDHKLTNNVALSPPGDADRGEHVFHFPQSPVQADSPLLPSMPMGSVLSNTDLSLPGAIPTSTQANPVALGTFPNHAAEVNDTPDSVIESGADSNAHVGEPLSPSKRHLDPRSNPRRRKIERAPSDRLRVARPSILLDGVSSGSSLRQDAAPTLAPVRPAMGKSNSTSRGTSSERIGQMSWRWRKGTDLNKLSYWDVFLLTLDILKELAKRYPAARAQYLIWRGERFWAGQHFGKARHAWKQALDAATASGFDYEEALVRSRLARTLDPSLYLGGSNVLRRHSPLGTAQTPGMGEAIHRGPRREETPDVSMSPAPNSARISDVVAPSPGERRFSTVAGLGARNAAIMHADRAEAIFTRMKATYHLEILQSGPPKVHALFVSA